MRKKSIKLRKSGSIENKDRKLNFLVHWKGYGDKYDQWIAETGLLHAKK